MSMDIQTDLGSAKGRNWPRRRHTLRAEQWIPRDLDEVFAFFSDAHNLNEVTPPWIHFQILTPHPIEMREGALIEYAIRLRLMPMRWRTKITVWDPPHRFVDEQLSGPYTLWHHEHSFEGLNGGTLVRDAVTYALPLGWSPVSRLMHACVVKPDLAKVFAFRRAALERRFGVSAPRHADTEARNNGR